MPEDATALADRLEAALIRIERARASTADRLKTLEAIVEGKVADLDRMLAAADPR